MTRLKITWKWNGEKIREESEPEKMVDANMEAPGTSPWKVSDIATLNKAGMRGSQKMCVRGPGGKIVNLPTPARVTGFIHYTNLIYQLLEGEVING